MIVVQVVVNVQWGAEPTHRLISSTTVPIPGAQLAAQLQIAEILGPRRFAQLHDSLEVLTEVLG